MSEERIIHVGYCAIKFLGMYELHRKQECAYAKTKLQISCAGTAQLISAFVFTTRIVQSFFFL